MRELRRAGLALVPSRGARAEPVKKIVILTSHVFLPGFRKASVHFVAQEWASRGHEVHFTTVGHSWLTSLKDRARFRAIRETQANRFEEVRPHLSAGAYLPPIHAFSSQNPIVNRLNALAFRAYGHHLPRFAREPLEQADLIVIESGTPICFFDYARALNPTARILYFCRDRLQSIGASPALRAIEARILPLFDRVCVPSKRLGEQLPPGGRVSVIPQGVDAALFERATVSPYPAGTTNAVSVGDMRFDEAAIAHMADASPHVTFHVFGAKWAGAPRDNVKVYGERSFETVVPNIAHADIGIAAYRTTEEERYLSESSLKLAQYSFCRLPILLPDSVPYAGKNAVSYRAEGETDWGGRVEAALSMPRPSELRGGIMTWRDIARRTLNAAFQP